MSYAFQENFLAVVMILWLGGAAVLIARFRKKQQEYLRRFPPVDGIPPGTSIFGFPFDAQFRAIKRAMLSRQADASLERLRRQAWKRYWLFAVWIFACPMASLGVLVILINLGLAR